jgi:DNA-binding transcriptional ArsR family regulator
MARPQASDDIFRAIADPIRRGILDRLIAHERPVGELAAEFSVTLSAISQHLRVLRQSGLVRERRQGRSRLYQINAAPLREVADWIAHYEGFWHARLDALERYLDRSRKENRR